MNAVEKPYVICAYHTPSYAALAGRLIESLRHHGESLDYAVIREANDGWERTTMRKPIEIRRAMRRHPAKTIIFLDVDNIAHGSLERLADTKADIACHMMVGKRSRGYGRMFARTSTMVLRQTDATHRFLGNWIDLCDEAPKGWVDQHTLPEAIAITRGLTVENISARYCAMPKDNIVNPIIEHLGAAKTARKIPGWVRAVNSMFHSSARV